MAFLLPHIKDVSSLLIDNDADENKDKIQAGNEEDQDRSHAETVTIVPKHNIQKRRYYPRKKLTTEQFNTYELYYYSKT